MLARGGLDIPTEEVMHHLPGPILAPLAKVVIHHPLRGEIMRQHVPGIATTQQLEDPVQDVTLASLRDATMQDR